MVDLLACRLRCRAYLFLSKARLRGQRFDRNSSHLDSASLESPLSRTILSVPLQRTRFRILHQQ